MVANAKSGSLRCSGTRKSSGVTGELLPHGGGWFAGRRAEFLRIPLREIPWSGTRRSSGVTGELLPHGGGWFAGRRAEFLRIPLREIPWSGTRRSSSVTGELLPHGGGWFAGRRAEFLRIPLGNSRVAELARVPALPASWFLMAAVGSRDDGSEFLRIPLREIPWSGTRKSSGVTGELLPHGGGWFTGRRVGILANSATRNSVERNSPEFRRYRRVGSPSRRLVHGATVGILANSATAETWGID
ncbi:MAG: hypothetical protein U1A77_14430 [Pirellulales bacterium]